MSRYFDSRGLPNIPGGGAQQEEYEEEEIKKKEAHNGRPIKERE